MNTSVQTLDTYPYPARIILGEYALEHAKAHNQPRQAATQILVVKPEFDFPTSIPEPAIRAYERGHHLVLQGDLKHAEDILKLLDHSLHLQHEDFQASIIPSDG